MKRKISNRLTTSIKNGTEKIKTKKLLSLFPLLFLFALTQCAEKETNTNTKKDYIPQKIVLGGETSGKILLIKNGKEKIIQEIKGAVFHQVIMSHDGKFIFAASSNQNKVYVFDGDNLSLIKTIDVGEHPTHMTFDDEGKILSVVNEDSGEVSFISVERLEELKRFSGFSTPHFARFYKNLWFVANFSSNRISVVDLEKGIVKELIPSGIPECEKNEECAFFDVSVKSGTGLAFHKKSGTIIEFNPHTLEITKLTGKENSPLLKKAYEGLEDVSAFRIVLSPFEPIAYGVFSKGVIMYDYVARDIFNIWISDEEFFSQFPIEYPGKVFVLLHDKNKIAILSKFKLEKIIDIEGVPVEGIYYNRYVYVFVTDEKNQRTKLLALDGEGKIFEIADENFFPAEGIHIPGAYPYCH
jgi:DNA-binding beta-propeller fold protein YncE